MFDQDYGSANKKDPISLRKSEQKKRTLKAEAVADSRGVGVNNFLSCPEMEGESKEMEREEEYHAWIL